MKDITAKKTRKNSVQFKIELPDSQSTPIQGPYVPAFTRTARIIDQDFPQVMKNLQKLNRYTPKNLAS